MAVLADTPPCTVNGDPVAIAQAEANPDMCDPGTGPNVGGGGSTDPDPPAPPDDGDGGTAPDPGGETGDGGDTGGGTAPDPSGDIGGGTVPDTGGDIGGGTVPDTGGDTGGGTVPDTGGDTGDGTVPDPGGDTGDSGDTGDDDADAKPKPAKPKPAKPKLTADQRRARKLRLRKERRGDRSVRFQDARTFRERYKPKGRLPELPELSQQAADQLVNAAEQGGVDWQVLAALAWIDSKFDNPVAGGLVGQRLTDGQWATYGTDGDADGTLDHASDVDRLATVAKLVATITAQRGQKAALREYLGTGVKARRARFLSAYFRALGTVAIVKGLEHDDTKAEIAQRVLDDRRLEIYAAGRSDIQAGLIDPRVLVAIEFLANRFGQVTVSSLVSGHSVFTVSGNVSNHAYGNAVDIAELGEQPIYGHQKGKRSRTVRALKDILRLPKSLWPTELISLWDLGDPSFALGDHHDHIHIGWSPQADMLRGEEGLEQ